MNTLIKTILTLISLFIINGCASHSNFINKYNSWVGKDISVFISQAGYPDRTYKLPNKNTVYVYEQSRLQSYPTMTIGYGGFYGLLEVNQKSKIIKWSSRGNNCISN
jgi:hypothetical protein